MLSLEAAAASRPPKLSVVVPVYNTLAHILEACIESVRQQSYANWELCICDDGSTSESTQIALARYKGCDPRIRIVRLETNTHISNASNMAAEQATGEFLVFLDHDDCLSADALSEISEAAKSSDDVDLIYSDEDKLTADGRYVDPYYKPDWSPDHLNSVMYVLHCLCIRKALFWKLGGFRVGFEGSQDYDLVLRAASIARKIYHIPKILYHWRITPGSAAADVNAKQYAHLAAERALNDAISRCDPPGRVEPGLLPGTFRARYPIVGTPPVTLAILTGYRKREVEGRGRICLVENFIRSIVRNTAYRNYNILVVDDEDKDCRAEDREAIQRYGARIVTCKERGKFNFAKKVNFALAKIETEHVVLLNDDLEVINDDWLECLLEHSQRREVGAVGARLLFADGSVQHAGIVCGINGCASHVFHRMPSGEVGYCGFSHLIRNYSAVTAAVFATRMSVINEVGSFDERFPVDFNDVDYCLRLRAAGYRIVYTPYSTLYHFEGSSISRQLPQDVDLFQQKWGADRLRDPYYNPNLPIDRSDFHIVT